MDVSLLRSDDYVRACLRLRHDVTRPVKWQRLPEKPWSNTQGT